MAASCILHNFDQIELESKWVENLISKLYNVTLQFRDDSIMSYTQIWHVYLSTINVDMAKHFYLQMWIIFSAIVHGKMLRWQKMLRLNFAISSLPERTYNPITAMEFLAMFTFQLVNTKR